MNYYREFRKGYGRRTHPHTGHRHVPHPRRLHLVSNALWMTLAATFVLIFSNIIVSIVKRCRIFVSPYSFHHCRLRHHRRAHAQGFQRTSINRSAFIRSSWSTASSWGARGVRLEKRVLPSVLDGLGMGLGFGLTLTVLASSGRYWDRTGSSGTRSFRYGAATIMTLAPGAFFTLAMMLWGMNALRSRKRR